MLKLAFELAGGGGTYSPSGVTLANRISMFSRAACHTKPTISRRISTFTRVLHERVHTVRGGNLVLPIIGGNLLPQASGAQLRDGNVGLQVDCNGAV